MLPQGLLLVGFYAYPLLDVIRLSFTNAKLLVPRYRYTLGSYLSGRERTERSAKPSRD